MNLRAPVRQLPKRSYRMDSLLLRVVILVAATSGRAGVEGGVVQAPGSNSDWWAGVPV